MRKNIIKTMKSIKMIGLTLGAPFDLHTRSGVNYNIFTRFKNKVDLIDVFDLDIKGTKKILGVIRSFSFNRRRWGNKLHQSPWAFKVRTSLAEQKIDELSGKPELIFQDGAMFMPGREPKVPFVSYHDGNVILSAQGGNFAHGAHYKGGKLAKTIAQEKVVYEKAALIFSMSDWLKKSFVHDFGIPEEKIITVYAGTNLKVEDFDKNYDSKTILFVGKNFERKGGKALLEAFKIVRKEIKDAKLIIIGSNLDINEVGVEVKGLITDKEELSKYFREAALFALPSLFEPFGIVFAEAFAFKNPCIGTNICAMPEIIEEGKGGFLVPPDDSKALADRIIMLLKDKNLSRKMGNYGFEKVKNIFNWDVVVDKILFHCSKIV